MSCIISNQIDAHLNEVDRNEELQAEIDYNAGLLLEGETVNGYSMEDVMNELSSQDDADQILMECVKYAIAHNSEIESLTRAAVDKVALDAINNKPQKD